VYSGTSRSYFVTGKTTGTYYYRVRANNAVGASPWRTGGNGCTIVPPPPPPSMTIPMTSVTGSYTVSWSSSSGATSYTLQEDTVATFTNPSTLYNGTSRSYFVSGKTSGTYYYRVNATNGAGSSTWTVGANGCTIVPPLAPSSITVPATSGSGNYTVSWGSSSGAVSYTLEEDTSATFTAPTAVYNGTSRTFSVTGRTTGTYYYRACANNGAGSSPWMVGANGCVVTLPPPAPVSITIPATSVTGNYAISWGAAPTALTYELQEATNTSFSSATSIYNGANLTFNVTGKTTGTFYYRVRAANSGGNGVWRTGSNGCQIVPPSPPATLTVPANSATGSYTISWTASTGALSYDLEESTNAGFSGATTVYTGLSITYNVTGNANGTFYYRVRATNQAGNSGWQTGSNGCVVLLPPPASSNVTVPSTSATGNYTVTWTAAPTATTYELQEDSNASFTTATTIYTGANLSFGITGKTTGTFYYRVRATNASGTGPWATGGNGCLLPPLAPGTVTVPSTSVTGNYTVSWASSLSATTYDLEEDTSSSFANPTTVYSGANPTFDITSKVSGTFFYRARAVNTAGPSPWTAGANACQIVAPAAPATVTLPATSYTGTFTVTWAASTGASAYDLEEDTSSSFTNPGVIYTGANATFDVTGKTSGTFYYRVRAVNGAGASGWTQGGNGLQIIVPPAPPALTVPAASQTGTYTVTWGGFSGAILYDLEEDTTAAFTNPTLLVASANTTHTVFARGNGTYFYRVRAVNGAGPSPWTTDPTGCTVTLAAPPPPPTITVPTQSATGSFAVQWSAATGAATYELEECTDSSFSSGVTQAYAGALTSHAVSGRANGTYWYRIRAVNSAGSSNWTTSTNGCGVSRALPDVPAFITVPGTSQTGTYTVSWLAASNATHYELQESMDDGSFGNPVNVYTGAAIYYDVSGRSDGTFYYRVRAVNAVGAGGWATDTAGCIVTAMTASLLVTTGAANPLDSVEVPGSTDVALLQFDCSTGVADGVQLQSVTVHITGSGDDVADIVSVDLWEDVDGNGRPGAGDIQIGSELFDGDDGSATFDLTSMTAITGGNSIRFVAACEFTAYVLSGSTFRARVNPAADVIAVSAGFALPISPGGLPVLGGTKRIETSGAGSLQVSLGANSPGSSTFSGPASNASMLQVLLSASTLEDGAVSAVRLSATGSGDESSGVTARLHEDLDGDGTVSPGDNELGAAAFTSDNGTVEFSGLSLVVPAGGSINLLVTYDFGSGTGPGTYTVSLGSGEDLETVGSVSQLGIVAKGAPVNGAAKNVIFVETTEAAYFMGGCSGGGNAPAHWAGYLLLLGAACLALRRRRARQS
jgi:hypothetical protein